MGRLLPRRCAVRSTALAALALSALVTLVHADPPDSEPLEPPDEQQISRLVQDLGSESYQVRKEAELALRNIGLPARDALRAGLKSDDLQTRRTCRRLLNDVLELDYQQRLARFIADKRGKLEHDLPGWERFRRLAGDDERARRLFAEMHREEGPLLVSVEAGNTAAVEALELRLQSIVDLMRSRNLRRRVQPSGGSVAAMLFAAGTPGLKLPDSLADDSRWGQIAYTQNFRQTLTDAATSDAAGKILGKWISLPTGKELLIQKLRLAMQYEVPQGLTLALHVLDRRDDYGRLKISYAIEAIGKIGGPEEASRLVPLLEDDGVILQAGGVRRPTSIEVRDVALGWLVHLTEQDLAEYGLPRAKPIFERLKANPANYSVSYTYFRFADKAKRDEALAKWKTWQAGHSLPGADARPSSANDGP